MALVSIIVKTGYVEETLIKISQAYDYCYYHITSEYRNSPVYVTFEYY